MLSRLLYHAILLPISWLPLSIIYLLFYPVYWLIYYVVGYRKKVVINNLERSFPQKSKAEIKKIAKRFYKHLSFILAESIKNLSISRKELAKRMVVENPEIMENLYRKKQPVILLSGHFQNWEFLITSQNFLFRHQAVGIGTPLTNQYLNQKINQKRGRFGMIITNNEEYKSVIHGDSSEPTSTLVLGDQSPSSSRNAFWVTFLNQTTPFFFGAEVMANQVNAAVVYCSIKQTKKGYYSIKLHEITQQPKSEPYGFILGQYVHLLEKDIIENPEYWLWSHRRWKISPPDDIEGLKTEHQKRFEHKFRN